RRLPRRALDGHAASPGVPPRGGARPVRPDRVVDVRVGEAAEKTEPQRRRDAEKIGRGGVPEYGVLVWGSVMSLWQWFTTYFLGSTGFWLIVILLVSTMSGASVPFARRVRLWQSKRRFMEAQS